MSKQADKIYQILKELFPHNIILKEYYLYYKGTRLFFDFFVKDLLFFLEIQGQQHFKFIKHFHNSMGGFLEQKRRDNLKLEYIEEHERLCLVRFNYNENVTREMLLKRINETLDSKVGYV